MASRRALAPAGCSSCRSAVFRLFAADSPMSAVTSQRIAERSLPIRGSRLTPVVSRAYTTTSRLLTSSAADTASRSQSESSPAETSPEETTENVEDHQSSAIDGANSESVPWYLQVEPPRHVATLEPPPLPTVPNDAPAILSAILQYASEEMGLDDLSLLDLRKLDPAPALGSNLFMLFGTARSERHLNVSAGRFVRWLRAKHRVQADADGLLGPNERKTKLRRKARKAKLLQIMGTDEADDGIRTGWVCVNLGTIGRTGPEQATVSDDGRVTGFGSAQEGISIVFQIMTEGRRAEMNLEGLWSESLAASLASHEEHSSIPGPAQPAAGNTSQTAGSASLLQSGLRPVMTGTQRRKLSSSQTSAYSTLSPLGLHMPTTQDSEAIRLKGAEPQEKQKVLELLRNFLLHGSQEEVALAVGLYPAEKAKETAFTVLYEAATHGLTPAQSWACRLTFHARCVENTVDLPHHAAITEELLRTMQLYGLPASREQYIELLGAICKATHINSASRQTELTLTLLNMMQQRGEPMLANDVLVTFLENFFTIKSQKSRPALLDNLWDLIAQAKLPCFSEPQLMRLLSAAARNRSQIWNVWNMPPRYFQRRSSAMYRHLLQLAAKSGSRQFCNQAVRSCLEGMPHERPPVGFEEPLVTELRQCINLANPTAERLAQREPITGENGQILEEGEFVAVLRRLNNPYGIAGL